MRSAAMTFVIIVAAGLTQVPDAPGSTRNTLVPSRPQTTAPAEFSRTRAVLVSEDFLIEGYHAGTVLRAAMKAGARAWVATTPQGRNSSSLANSSLKSKLLEIGLSAAEASSVRAMPLAHGNIWLRDYGPQWVTSNHGRTLTALDFEVGGSLPENEIFPAALARALKLPVVHAPVSLEGGNVLADGQTCVIGLAREELAAKNSTRSLESLRTALACKNLVVVADPPHPHADMWLKLPAPGVALVNRLDEATMALLKKIYGQVPREFLMLARRLDEIAAQLGKHFDVRRLPMPLPYRGTFRTYANSIIVNSVAIVPRFKRFGWNYDDYPDAHLAADYERAVEQVYRDVGLKTEFIEADGLIYNGGSFHCAVLQIPEIKPQSKQGAR